MYISKWLLFLRLNEYLLLDQSLDLGINDTIVEHRTETIV